MKAREAMEARKLNATIWADETLAAAEMRLEWIIDDLGRAAEYLDTCERPGDAREIEWLRSLLEAAMEKLQPLLKRARRPAEKALKEREGILNRDAKT